MYHQQTVSDKNEDCLVKLLCKFRKRVAQCLILVGHLHENYSIWNADHISYLCLQDDKKSL